MKSKLELYRIKIGPLGEINQLTLGVAHQLASALI